MPRYAGVGVRLAALLVDFLLLSAVFFPVTRLVKGVWLMQPSDHRWVSGWFVTDPLRVVGPAENRPGLGRGVIRNVLRLVDALPALNILGVVLIATSPERARFGDRVANTRVIFARRAGR